eukprot:12152966-Alexandrium_andersonii.AAC.1
MKTRRNRLIWTRVRVSAFADQERLFQKWTATLYEKRWHAVTSLLKCLHPLFGVLCQVWDER